MLVLGALGVDHAMVSRPVGHRLLLSLIRPWVIAQLKGLAWPLQSRLASLLSPCRFLRGVAEPATLTFSGHFQYRKGLAEHLSTTKLQWKTRSFKR